MFTFIFGKKLFEPAKTQKEHNVLESDQTMQEKGETNTNDSSRNILLRGISSIGTAIGGALVGFFLVIAIIINHIANLKDDQKGKGE